MSNQLFRDNGIQPKISNKTKCTVGKISKNVAAVLPAYNEEVSIGSIVLLTKLYADNVIVVDDASSDRTAEIAKKAGAEVIAHTTNRGQDAALETGFKAAADLGADIIVAMSSNGHQNPADIPRLVAPIIKGSADIVNGSLYLNSPERTTPVYRRVGQTLLGKFTNKSPRKIADSQSIFRAFAASTKDIIHFDAQCMIIESKTVADAGKSGLRIKEVEIGTHHNFGDQVRDPIKYILGVLKTLVKDIEVNKPLYFYAVPGFALATCGFYMGLKFLEAIILGIENLHYWPVFLMTFLSVAGVYMTIRGIVIHSLVEVTTQTEAV
ncbi:glycosyltransferase family 2 protein [Methanosarcina sp.]|uniref:glycosyltransferase family 2 protein n=1 Tax=Methanosarcina sp. TaxID=2213 RepID=UPI003C714305